ncbi:MAG: protein kinase [Deltaproteobacteria bacterium]|nr:protein kinase [Deltaproteobacteria bacterium]
MRFEQAQKHPRYRTDVPVALLLPDGRSVEGPAENISSGGVFVRTPYLLSPGTRMYLELKQPAPGLVLPASVVHVMDPEKARTRNHPTGMGLRFESVDEQAAWQLQRYLFYLFRGGQRITVPTHLTPAGPGEWAPGGRIGRCVLLHKLGQGGMAEVWLARREGFDKTMVLKTISARFRGDAAMAQLFLDEARLAAGLNHPAIVQTFDMGEHEGIPYLLMEHLDGRSVAQVQEAAAARQEPVPVALAVRVASECCAALEHAHAAGIVHRDVTPENLFITYAGHVKLLDFGIARAAQSVHHTLPGVIRGKLHYLSPEQVRAEELDGRTDLWAVGVNLYKLVTGTFPFTGRGELETFWAIVDKEPPAPRALRPDVPDALQDIIRRALAKQADCRFQSAGEMRAALESCLEDPAGTFQLAATMESLFPAQSDPQRMRVATFVPTSTPPAMDASFLAASAALRAARPDATPPAITAHPTLSRLGLAGLALALAAAGSAAALYVARPAVPPTAAPPVAAEPAPVPVPPATTGFLRVDSNMEGLVSVDGRGARVTPALFVDLAPGEHLVRLDTPQGRSRTTVVRVDAGATAQVTLRFPDRVLDSH